MFVSLLGSDNALFLFSCSVLPNCVTELSIIICLVAQLALEPVALINLASSCNHCRMMTLHVSVMTQLAALHQYFSTLLHLHPRKQQAAHNPATIINIPKLTPPIMEKRRISRITLYLHKQTFPLVPLLPLTNR